MGSQDVRSHFHDLEFSWDTSWLRWHLDESIIYEEPIRAAPSRWADLAETTNGSVSVEFSHFVAPRAVKAETTSAEEEDGTVTPASRFQVEKIHLKQGGLEDAACLPRHRTNANCRKKTREWET